VKLIVKHFYLADILSMKGRGVILHSDKYNINASVYVSV